MKKGFVKLSLITSIILNSNIYAADGFDEEDEFGNEDAISIVKVEKEVAYSIYGDVKLFTSYNYAHDKTSPIGNDFRGFSSLKTSANINLEYKLNKDYKIKSNLKASKDFIYDLKSSDYNIVPKGYEYHSDINELYIQGSLNNNIDIKIGRQIVVWGKSDNIRITDTLNGLDNKSPGMVDIKDLKLGRVMSKIDYSKNKWTYSAIALHENRYSLTPQYGSDFAAPAITNTVEQADTLENSGLALSAVGNLEGQDISLYASHQYVDNTNYKSNMLGFAYAKALGSFVLKAELAHFDNYDGDVIKNKTDSLVGIEYNGIKDGSLSFETANKDNNIQYAVRFSQSYINQTLDYTLLISAFGKEANDGGFIRTWLDYDVNDNISINVGFINYMGGDNQRFEMIKDNDRMFASVSYNF